MAKRPLANHYKKVLEEINKHQLRLLKQVDRKRLHETAKEMNEVLWHNETTDITENNRLKRAAAVVAFRNLTRKPKVEERASLVKKNLRKQGSTKRILAEVLPQSAQINCRAAQLEIGSVPQSMNHGRTIQCVKNPSLSWETLWITSGP